VTKTRSPPYRCARICCHAERLTKETNDRWLVARVTDSPTYNFLASATRLMNNLNHSLTGPDTPRGVHHMNVVREAEDEEGSIDERHITTEVRTTSGLTTSKMGRKYVLDWTTPAPTPVQVSLPRGAPPSHSNSYDKANGSIVCQMARACAHPT